MRQIFKIILVLCTLIILGSLGCRRTKINTITVGSKHFTEQEILGEIMSIMIEENTGIEVFRRFNLGGTMICFNALRAGDIDLYAEYTGTGLVNILKQKAIIDPENTYKIVKKEFEKKFNMVWLEPFGFNNTYTLTIRKGQAKSLGIKTISDLAQHSHMLRPGFDAEFMERPDGYRGLIKHYGFEFNEKPKQMDPGLMYKALAEKGVDIIDGFATDGRIPAYDLVILEDDKNFFPPYYAAPLIRKKTLSKYPQLKTLLNRLSGLISNNIMRELNYQADKEQKSPSDIARMFLRNNELIKKGLDK